MLLLWLKHLTIQSSTPAQSTGRTRKLHALVISAFGTRVSEKNWHLLRNAVFERRYSDALALLKEHPELINARNGIGETVLHFLAVEDDLEGVAWLHERGFSLDTKNEFGTPVIFEVAQLANKDLLEWFKENGTDFSVKDKDGQDITEYLKEYEKDEMAAYVNKMRT